MIIKRMQMKLSYCAQMAVLLHLSNMNTNFGKIPLKFVIIKDQKKDFEIEDIQITLLKMSDLYGPKLELLKLFGRHKNHDNVLFSNTANRFETCERFVFGN